MSAKGTFCEFIDHIRGWQHPDWQQKFSASQNRWRRSSYLLPEGATPWTSKICPSPSYFPYSTSPQYLQQRMTWRVIVKIPTPAHVGGRDRLRGQRLITHINHLWVNHLKSLLNKVRSYYWAAWVSEHSHLALEIYQLGFFLFLFSFHFACSLLTPCSSVNLNTSHPQYNTVLSPFAHTQMYMGGAWCLSLPHSGGSLTHSDVGFLIFFSGTNFRFFSLLVKRLNLFMSDIISLFEQIERL